MNNKFNMKMIVLALTGIMLVSFGIGFGIIFSTGINFNYKDKPSYISDNNIKSKVQSSKEDNGEQTSSQNNAINEDSGEDTSSQNNNIDESKTEKLQGIEKIDISVAAAAINVIPKGTEEINAHLYGNIEIAGSKNKPELQCYASGNTLFIIEKMNEGNYNKMDSSNQNLKLDVCVPASFSKNIKLSAAVGDLNISQFKLDKLECNPSLGKLSINNITANTFNYVSGTGDLTATGLHTKDSFLHASLGKIEISDFTGNLTAASSSGDIIIRYSSFNNNVDVKESLGKVQLQLPEKSQFSLDAKTSLGKLDCNFPVTVTGIKKENQLQGTVVSDKNKVKLNVSTGDISVNYN